MSMHDWKVYGRLLTVAAIAVAAPYCAWNGHPGFAIWFAAGFGYNIRGIIEGTPP